LVEAEACVPRAGYRLEVDEARAHSGEGHDERDQEAQKAATGCVRLWAPDWSLGASRAPSRQEGTQRRRARRPRGRLRARLTAELLGAALDARRLRARRLWS
jgi:hypothetical protein